MPTFIFGKSDAMQKVRQQVEKFADVDIPIFIEGETGTGKSLLAAHIHQLSAQRNGVFQRLDCATMPATLVESELFGHEKGAFTGADAKKSGLFELACGGTIFLDEVENLDLPIQAKLLNILDARKFRRLGGKDELEIYFRILSASNDHIGRRVELGTFREDLYYRLTGTGIYLPPLRQRPEDIPELAVHFIEEINKKQRLEKKLSTETLHYLAKYSWPGNVRELYFALFEAATQGEGIEILPGHFSLRKKIDFVLADSNEKRFTLTEMEKRYIRLILDSVHGNKSRTAKRLGIGVATLYRKLQKYGIK